MNRVFAIGDTHFGHKRIIEFEAVNRPYATIEEHDRDLVARWNAAVKPNDTVCSGTSGLSSSRPSTARMPRLRNMTGIWSPAGMPPLSQTIRSGTWGTCSSGRMGTTS